VAVDRDVATRFRDGDPDAVREVYRHYGRLVYAVAYRVVGDPGLAEEATQVAFLKAWRAADRLDNSRDIGPWLVSIARRAAIDVYRREALRRTDPLEAAQPGDSALLSRPESAEAVYDIWEVRRAVAELPAQEREIIALPLGRKLLGKRSTLRRAFHRGPTYTVTLTVRDNRGDAARLQLQLHMARLPQGAPGT
jgi:RNA polymerase sigma factor (sigma-70 family)